MKPYQLMVGLLAFFLSAGYHTFGQQRTCDMEVTLLSPTDQQVIPAFASFEIKINLKNLGPDSLETGDTLFYNTSLVPVISAEPLVLTQPIAPGETATILLDEVVNLNENPSDFEQDFCVKVLGEFNNQGSISDPVSANNTDCHTVTFEAGTGLASVNQDDPTPVLSPNPAHDRLQVSLPDAAPFRGESRIIDLQGRVVTVIPQAKDNPKQMTISVADLPAGMYIFQYVAEGMTMQAKFVKR